MNISCEEIGLKENNLYEVLATTFSINNSKIIPNTACMGIRLINKDVIQFSPYSNTKTYENIKEQPYVIFNLIDDIYYYALASLKKQNSDFKGILNDQYQFFKFANTLKKEIQLPFLKNAWAIIVCKIIDDTPIIKRDDLGENLIIEVKLRVLYCNKYASSNKLYNRAENLALEAIILATRLKVAQELNKSELIMIIHEKINQYIKDINRFCKNLNVLKTIDYLKKYIQVIMD